MLICSITKIGHIFNYIYDLYVLLVLEFDPDCVLFDRFHFSNEIIDTYEIHG